MPQTPPPPAPPRAARRPWGALGLIVLVVVLAGAAVWPMITAVAARVFGPSGIELREVFAPGDRSIIFDHGEFTAILSAVVDDDGWVDYGLLFDDPRPLDSYLTQLANADLDALGRDEKLALLVNAYNALTMRTIVDHWPLASVQAIPDGPLGRGREWVVGGQQLTLAALEQEWLRGKFAEPRTHFAINPGTAGGAPLRREAYAGARIEEQLADQVRRVHTSARWFELLDAGGVLRLTPVYLWFANDFQQVEGSLLAFVRKSSPALDAWCAANGTPSVLWLDYDWRHNGLEHRPG